ncbi:MAG: imidazoleglycerol-phosphate dehydratase HisB [Fibrobacterota bacterium]
MSRRAEEKRKTAETDIAVHLDLDGMGRSTVSSGNAFFDHMLTAFARHGLFDMDIKCIGDIEVDFHHSAEDIGITLGKAFKKALGRAVGITRYSHSYVPMDEALIRTAADICGRSNLIYAEDLRDRRIHDFEVDLVYDFLKGFTDNAGVTLHVDILKARNSHHAVEAIFKSLGRTMRSACSIDSAAADQIPSTKGTL